MSNEREFFKKRLLELAGRAYASGVFTFTDFLGLDEQSVFAEVKTSLSGIKYTLFGGTVGTERVMVRFGDEEELGWCADFPIVTLKIEPKAKKWADKLTHRDILGALMNLGIERSQLGDIVIRADEAYLFAKNTVSDFIMQELTRAKHTDLLVSIVDSVPEGELYKTEDLTVQCASQRADAVIARVFSLSREEAQELFKEGRVFINGKCTESVARELSNDEIVSVRGLGRFIFAGLISTSKKGKLNLLIKRFV